MQGCRRSSTLLLQANPFSPRFHTFARAILVFLRDVFESLWKMSPLYEMCVISFFKESVIYASFENNEYRISVTMVQYINYALKVVTQVTILRTTRRKKNYVKSKEQYSILTIFDFVGSFFASKK